MGTTQEQTGLRLLVAGGTGALGRRIVPAILQRGYRVRLLVRSPQVAAAHVPADVELIPWEAGQPVPASALEGVWGVLNFAGAPIARRWTAAYRQEILRSRVEGTRAIAQALRRSGLGVQVFLSVSATGYYGDRGDELCTEESPPGRDFLASVCRQWEEAAHEAEGSARVVIPRLGVAIDSRAGMLARLLPAFRAFVGGSLCSGRQWVSWVHWSDVVGFVLWALQTPTVRGVYNLVAPEPVRFRDMCRLLGKLLSRPCWLVVPRWALRLRYGGLADALCASQRVVPQRLLAEGFHFCYTRLDDALRRELLQPEAAPETVP